MIPASPSGLPLRYQPPRHVVLPLTDGPQEASIFVTVACARHPAHMERLKAFPVDRPHVNIRFVVPEAIEP